MPMTRRVWPTLSASSSRTGRSAYPERFCMSMVDTTRSGTHRTRPNKSQRKGEASMSDTEWEPAGGLDSWLEYLDLFSWVPRPVFARPAGLASLGRESYIIEPYKIRSPHRVHIGDNVAIGEHSFLSVVESHL